MTPSRSTSTPSRASARTRSGSASSWAGLGGANGAVFSAASSAVTSGALAARPAWVRSPDHAVLHDEVGLRLERGAQLRRGHPERGGEDADVDAGVPGVRPVVLADPRLGGVDQRGQRRRVDEPRPDPHRGAVAGQLVAQRVRRAGRQPAGPGEVVGIEPGPGGEQPLPDRLGQPGRRVLRPAGGDHVEHLGAGHGGSPAEVAQHQPVAGGEGQRLVEAEPPVAGVVVEGPVGDPVLPRADRGVEAVAARRRRARHRGDRDVDDGGGRPLVGSHHGVAPPELAVLDAGQVEGHPGARVGRVDPSPAGLDAADPGLVPAGQHRVVDPEGAAGQGAGHDRSRALRREDPIDPEAGPAAVGGGGRGAEHRVEARRARRPAPVPSANRTPRSAPRRGRRR